MMKIQVQKCSIWKKLLLLLCGSMLGALLTLTATAGTIAQSPLFVGISAPPLIMLIMGRDHKLYYEAYNDASDLNGDGVLEIRYNPAIDYFGYFDSYKCYNYSSGLFVPAATTADKKCSGAWSGDFLNYLTTSRMDALRKVLFGGYRSTDSTTQTVLERAHIPQDAHSWGKEYTSVAVDGYNITEYTPLPLPAKGTRHLFANTTLLNTTDPLLRVLTNSSYRIWEWVSIERPVAGAECATGNNVRANCEVVGSSSWQIVPASYFSELTQTTYNTIGYGAYPNSTAEFNSLVSAYGIPAKRFGSGSVPNINGSGNPFGNDDDYLTIFQGNLIIPAGESDVYTFAVDGDDAIDVIIDGAVVASWYGAHGNCNPNNCTPHSGSVTLTAGTHSIVFRHQERSGGDNYYLYWQKTVPTSAMTDYKVRVQVCVSGLLEDNCKGYTSDGTTIYKPTGLLHEHGENDSMMFGLITGSYTKNTSGGVLRKNVLSFTNEVNPNTGQFVSGSGGIVETINKLKTVGFGSGYQYNQNCGVPEVNNPLAEGRCRMWGNPIGEMMYEGLRYFAGKASPTSDFSSGVNTSGTDDNALGLPQPNWLNPYTGNMGADYANGYPTCSKPSQLVISDVNPSYDTDKLPGSYFNSFSGDLTGLDVSSSADTIWAGESEATNIFIGQSGGSYDGAPTPKTVTSFSNIRGLTPEEPTRQGGYYSAAAALFGKTNDLNNVSGDQKTDTLSVALASPLPRIEIPVDGKTITLVPFGKTVGGCGSFSSAKGSYQPTNTIVDFYVDTIKNTGAANQDATVNGGRAYGKFRINYEDSEYGSDHDMDAIVEYTFTVNSNGTVTVNLNSDYAAGSCIQHMGYVISGTTADGTYLEVRDSDTSTSSDVDYFLDTPPGQTPGGTWIDHQPLPLSTTRTFTPGATTASFIKHDPLWYAAKWGGFFDKKDPSTNKGNNQLDDDEWDLDGNGIPDSYFLVTNAGQLKDQLTNAFNEIKGRIGSAASIATNSTRLDTGTLIYQAKFDSTDWSGHLLAFAIDPDGSIHDADGDGIIDDDDAVWDAAGGIPSASTRDIFSYNPTATGTKGISFTWASLNAAQKAALGSEDLVNYLRGDQSKEKNSGPFRKRKNLLGDIVNSDPWFAGAENFGYSILTEGSSGVYEAFLATKKNRKRMLYVGANDGMLHAFNAGTYDSDAGLFNLGNGEEVFAYVPNAVINSNLAALASDPYTHKYLVDGSPRVGDAYINGAWRSVLVGTTGAGGRGVFALDVTAPDSFDPTSVLWEFTSANDTDLGYTLPQASIGRMANGDWAAVVANGYNSTGGEAVLFILNLANGEIIKEIHTGAAGNNGLSTPIIVDSNNDRIVDYIYAGDLLGNLWKFDVTSNNINNWGVAYKSGSTPQPLFVACSSSATPCTGANRQPITAKPQVGRPGGDQDGGLMVYFGTGKYFEDGDNLVGSNPQVQTFYGLWDRNTGNKNKDVIAGSLRSGDGSILQEQTIDYEVTLGFFDLRVSSQNAVDYDEKSGWFMDLKKPPQPGTAEGERVVSAPLLRGGRVIFTTLIPSANPCDYGGTGWLMEMDALTGARLPNTGAPWDVYGEDGTPDGQINAHDLVNIGGSAYAPSGKKSSIGIIKTPGVISAGEKEYKYTSGSSGSLEGTTESAGAPTGRQSWAQIK
jgi:type IV pilus assembly protein PilY1